MVAVRLVCFMGENWVYLRCDLFLSLFFYHRQQENAMYASRNAQIYRFSLSHRAFYPDLPGKCTAIAMRIARFEVLTGVKALFPVQFEPPWC